MSWSLLAKLQADKAAQLACVHWEAALETLLLTCCSLQGARRIPIGCNWICQRGCKNRRKPGGCAWTWRKVSGYSTGHLLNFLWCPATMSKHRGHDQGWFTSVSWRIAESFTNYLSLMSTICRWQLHLLIPRLSATALQFLELITNSS